MNIAAQSSKEMYKNIIYFTDNSLDPLFAQRFRDNLLWAANDIPIISVSQQPIDFGFNICIGDIGRSLHSMWKQILTGVLYSKADIVFMAEHDVLYHRSHFEFVPLEDNVFYYNNSVWLVRSRDGRCLWKPNLCFSQCVSNRLIMLNNIMQRVKWCEAGHVAPLHVGAYEPGRIRKTRADERKIFGINTDLKWRLERFATYPPCVDIRHGRNYSGDRRFKIRQQDEAIVTITESGAKKVGNRIYADEVPSWGSPKGRFDDWFLEVTKNAPQTH